MARKLDMSVEALISALSPPKRMRRSVLTGDGNLSALAAERIIRAARMQKRATDVFESELDARVAQSR